MKAVEKLAEIAAENKLKKLGWIKDQCPKCGGQKSFAIHTSNSLQSPLSIEYKDCNWCDADGYIWALAKEEK